MGDGLLTPADLAERWSMSVGTLANLRSARKGPAYLRIGGAVRYRPEDIERYESEAMVNV